ncbi:MAG: flagellar M-ring protein FliF [Candidatus Magnetoovum sp. WYHC-5]|nr:flagellar M-ring protein FliF [Candidatus Magnetoovum sp. WYHC-5]
MQTNLIDYVKGWSKRTKIIVLTVLMVSIAFMVLVFAWSSQTDYAVLYSNLSESDAGEIVAKLKSMNVLYKVTSNSIMVEKEQVYDLRMQMASEGIPKGGTIGFEIFDTMNFQTTDFVQKLNYKRALEGELARTINTLSEIQSSRVHLALPERSLFVKDQEKPSASILVKLYKGNTLTEHQILGIVNLVSSSVEGLEPGSVKIVDSYGNLLTRPMDEFVALTTNQLDYKRKYEKAVEETIIRILEPVVGSGKVKAQVSTALDFSRTEKTEEKYDPDGQVARSEQSTTEKSKGVRPGGVPGVESNVPQKAGNESSTQSTTESQKATETTNFEVSKVTSKIVDPYGEVKRLTAAILVDGSYKQPDKANGKSSNASAVYVPRTDDELKKYEGLIKQAIGFTTDRGDEITVVNMPFQALPEKELPDMRTNYVDAVLKALKYIAPLLLALLFFLFIVRPVMRSMTSQPPAGRDVPIPDIASLEREMREGLPGAERALPIPPEEEYNLQREIEEWSLWVKENPSQAAILIKEWVEIEGEQEA